MKRYHIAVGILVSSSMLFATEVNLEKIHVCTEKEEVMLHDRVTQNTASLAKKAKGETLGDYLEDEQFVDSATYGPAVGRPVVRGMDGYRVGITTGNIVLNDLSAMSQDHAVGVMPRASEKIELLKGPSSLLYGNYTGGVVRVIGEESEPELMKKGVSFDTDASYGSNGAGTQLGGTLKLSDGIVSVNANTYSFDAEAYKDGLGREVKDSNMLSRQSHAVLGYQLDSQNVIKIFADTLTKDYGIPNATPEATTIEMEQEQYGIIWHAKDLFGFINHMQNEIQTSDYLHSELEGGRADGLFGQKQTSFSSMFDFDKEDWNIVTNLEYLSSALKVCHDHGKCTEFYDAIRTSIIDGVELQKNIDKLGLPYAHGHPMPNIDESLIKAGVSASRALDEDHEVTLALRGEFRTLTPDSVNIQEVWLVTPEIDPNYYDVVNDNAFSISGGYSSFVNDIFSYQTSLSYVERLPASTELFWNGFHHATDSYIFGDRYLDNEQSVNFDVDTLFDFKPFSTQLSAFYYHFYNYIYQEPLANEYGKPVLDPFHGAAVWAITEAEANVFGAALKENYVKEIREHRFDTSLSFEAIRGILTEGGNLPRIPTFSTTLALDYSYQAYKANLSYKYVAASRFEAENETYTPGYNWVSALISYDMKNSYFDGSLYLKGENLTDDIAYNNLSFLKATAPLPGRQISIGLELKF